MRLHHFAAALSAVSLLSFAAAACSKRSDAPNAASSYEPSAPIESSALPADAIATPAAQAAPIAAADRGEEGAKTVLAAWASALESRDFARARSLWGEAAASEEAIARFAEYRRIVVSFGEGRIEGAAGSLYYEAPVNFTGILANGTPIRRAGTIVLRRVNDVPGATPEQLRWRIYRTSLQV
jgi:hypothetical protein